MNLNDNIKKIVLATLLLSIFLFFILSSTNSPPNTERNNSTSEPDISPLALVPQNANVVGYYDGNKTIETRTIKNISDFALSAGLIDEPTNDLVGNTNLNKYSNIIESVAIYRTFDGNSTNITKIRDLNVAIKSDISKPEMISVLDDMYKISQKPTRNSITQLRISVAEQQVISYYRRIQIQNNTFHILSNSNSKVSTVSNNTLDSFEQANLRLRVTDIQDAQKISSLVSKDSVSIDKATYVRYNDRTELDIYFKNESVAEVFARRLNLGVSYLSVLEQTEYNTSSDAFALTRVERTGKTVSILYRGNYEELYQSISRVDIERAFPD